MGNKYCTQSRSDHMPNVLFVYDNILSRKLCVEFHIRNLCIKIMQPGDTYGISMSQFGNQIYKSEHSTNDGKN